MHFNSYHTPGKNPIFDYSFKHTMCLLLIVILIFTVSAIATLMGDDEENSIVKNEHKKIIRIQTVDTEVETGSVLFDVPLDEDIQKYLLMMCAECNTCDLDPAIVIAIIWRESEFDAGAIGDNGNSLGLMQIQPRWHSERMEKAGVTDLLDPYQNIRVGIDYLIELYSINGDIEWVLMAYNGGPTYANSLRSQGLVSDYALDILDKAEDLKTDSRF